jgi:hypothetical protein
VAPRWEREVILPNDHPQSKGQDPSSVNVTLNPYIDERGQLYLWPIYLCRPVRQQTADFDDDDAVEGQPDLG